jgi:hypothetical protein
MDALRRVVAHIAVGGTYIADYPGELTHYDNASFKWRGPKYYIDGELRIWPDDAVRYLLSRARRDAVSAFACATMSVTDAARWLWLREEDVIARAERGELGGVKIQIPGERKGVWFLSYSHVLSADPEGAEQRFRLSMSRLRSRPRGNA